MADKEAAWLATADPTWISYSETTKKAGFVYVNTFQPVFGIEYTGTESWVVRPMNRYKTGKKILIKTIVPGSQYPFRYVESSYPLRFLAPLQAPGPL